MSLKIEVTEEDLAAAIHALSGAPFWSTWELVQLAAMAGEEDALHAVRYCRHRAARMMEALKKAKEQDAR